MTTAVTEAPAAAKPLGMLLQMPGCFLATATHAAEEYFTDRIGKSFLQTADDCVCLVLGGPNAYLEEFCQLESVGCDENLADGAPSKPRLIAFSYPKWSDDGPLDQNSAVRTYKLLIFTARKNSLAVGDAALSVLLWPLPAKYNVTIHDLVPCDRGFRALKVPAAFRLALGGQVIVPRFTLDSAIRSKLEQINSFIGLVEQVLARNPTSRRDAWKAVEAERGEIAKHVPLSVVLDFCNAGTSEEAFGKLKRAVSNPADAPVLMSLFGDLIEKIARDPETRAIYEAPSKLSDEDYDILDLSDEELDRAEWINALILQMRLASPAQLRRVADRLGVASNGELRQEDLFKDCLSLLAKQRNEDGLLREVQGILE